VALSDQDHRRPLRRLAAHIETNHGYETPELTAVPIDHGSTAYLGWVSSATANP
jgi:uncharacterized protein involved in tolerance to divalent cations